MLEQFLCLYLHLPVSYHSVHKNKHNYTIQTTLNRQVSHSGNHISNSPNVFYMLYRLIAHLLHDSFVSIPRILSSGSLICSTDELIINLQQKKNLQKAVIISNTSNNHTSHYQDISHNIVLQRMISGGQQCVGPRQSLLNHR